MIFEPGKFYLHNAGRKIAILAEVDTYRWSKMLVVEEADGTGHSISCSDSGQPVDPELWIEIGKAEWLEEFTTKKAANG